MSIVSYPWGVMLAALTPLLLSTLCRLGGKLTMHEVII